MSEEDGLVPRTVSVVVVATVEAVNDEEAVTALENLVRRDLVHRGRIVREDDGGVHIRPPDLPRLDGTGMPVRVYGVLGLKRAIADADRQPAAHGVALASEGNMIVDMDVMVGLRGAGKTYRLVEWLTEGHPIPGNPKWSRMIIAAALDPKHYAHQIPPALERKLWQVYPPGLRKLEVAYDRGENLFTDNKVLFRRGPSVRGRFPV